MGVAKGLGLGTPFGRRPNMAGGAPPVVLKHRALETFIAAGNWSSPAGAIWHQDGTAEGYQANAWAGGGGSTLAVGAGGGGEFRGSKLARSALGAVIPIGGIAGGAIGVSGANTTVNATEVVAVGGASGLLGGAGGTGGTGTVGRDGGAGTLGAGNTTGGAGAGRNTAAVGAVPGEPGGGFGVIGNTIPRTRGAGGGGSATTNVGGVRGAAEIEYDIEAVAGYPRCVGRAGGRDLADTTSRAAVLTMAGDSAIEAGELLCLWVPCDGTGVAITVAGWTALTAVNEAAQICGRFFYTTAAGADTATIATDSTQQISHFSWRWKNAGVPEQTTATSASGTSVNCPLHTYSLSPATVKAVVLACAGTDANAVPNLTAFPAGYTAFREIMAATVTGVQALAAEKFIDAASEDPGAYTLNASEQAVMVTVLIPFAA